MLSIQFTILLLDVIPKSSLLFYDGENVTLHEVRTRKVIIISESIASLVNAGIVLIAVKRGAGDLVKKVDIGGYISTIFHLFNDIRFITKIKKDFIAKAIEENYQDKLAQVK